MSDDALKQIDEALNDPEARYDSRIRKGALTADREEIVRLRNALAAEKENCSVECAAIDAPLVTRLLAAEKERDEARAACAEMRGLLEDVADSIDIVQMTRAEPLPINLAGARDAIRRTLAATDTGKDFVPRALLDECADHLKRADEHLERSAAELRLAVETRNEMNEQRIEVIKRNLSLEAELSRVQAQCAELRAAFLEYREHGQSEDGKWCHWVSDITGPECVCGLREVERRVLEQDAGKGYVSPEQHRAEVERAVAEEREACAKAAEDTDPVEMGWGYMRQDDASGTIRAVAEAIRARGAKPSEGKS